VRVGHTSARVENADRVELHRTETFAHVYVGDVVLFAEPELLAEKLSEALTLCQDQMDRESEVEDAPGLADLAGVDVDGTIKVLSVLSSWEVPDGIR
jgi:hypothetical protein